MDNLLKSFKMEGLKKHALSKEDIRSIKGGTSSTVVFSNGVGSFDDDGVGEDVLPNTPSFQDDGIGEDL